jgi:hypothetical protein
VSVEDVVSVRERERDVVNVRDVGDVVNVEDIMDVGDDRRRRKLIK